MRGKFEKGSEIWAFWKDFYNLVEYYYEVESSNQAYWEEALDVANKVYKRYEKLPLAKYLVLAFLEYLSSEDRRKRGIN